MIRRLPARLALCGVVVLGALGTVVAPRGTRHGCRSLRHAIGHGVALPAGAGR